MCRLLPGPVTDRMAYASWRLPSPRSDAAHRIHGSCRRRRSRGSWPRTRRACVPTCASPCRSPVPCSSRSRRAPPGATSSSSCCSRWRRSRSSLRSWARRSTASRAGDAAWSWRRALGRGAPVPRDGAVHHQAVARGTRRLPARVRRARAPEDLRRRAGRLGAGRWSTTRASWCRANSRLALVSLDREHGGWRAGLPAPGDLRRRAWSLILAMIVFGVGDRARA